MNNRYFTPLLVALGVALALVVMNAELPKLPLWLSFAPVIPLIVYHLVILSPHAKDLRSSEIDSVYYFGFLVTVAALAATAVELARAGDDARVESVLYKFGVGLLATGYAVIARLHLQSLPSSDIPGTPEQALDAYIARSGALLDNVDRAIVNIESLASKAMEETQSVSETSRALLEETALKAAGTFQSELHKSLESARQSVAEVKAILKDADFTTDTQEFHRLLRESASASGEFVSAISSLSGGALAGADTLQRANGELSALGTTARVAAEGLGALTGDRGVVTSLATHLEATSKGAERAANAAQDAAIGVKQMATTLEGGNAALGQFERSTSAVSKALEDLTSSSRRLDSSIALMTQAIEASRGLAEGLNEVGREMPGLTPKVQTLGTGLDDLRSTLNSTAASLEKDVDRSVRAVGLLADNLAAVAQTIIDRTNGRHARV